jgi:hypothetical protein
MIYRSNLEAPDLQPYFHYAHSRVMAHSMGHDVLSDWAEKADDDPEFSLYKQCGFWTHDEAAILYNIAKALPGPYWLDIGAHTGWTTAHIVAAGGFAYALEPLWPDVRMPNDPFRRQVVKRFSENTDPIGDQYIGHVTGALGLRSDHYFAVLGKYGPGVNGCAPFVGVVIDGDHHRPCPLQDAMNAAAHLKDTGVILLHDFIGRPVQEAVEYLLDYGFKCRAYWTPHMVACCWRGDFSPPAHSRDPHINWQYVRTLMPEFDFARCE